MNDFDQFVSQAWTDHAERPAEVAARLEAALGEINQPARVPPYVRLVGHVHGEHLGHWHDGIALLERLRRQPGATGPAAVTAIEVTVGALRCCADRNAPLDHLAPPERAAALAGAAAALAGRNDFDGAIPLLDEARRHAPGDLAPGAPAARALGVAGNNLAAALEEKPDRNAAETAAMIAAAETGLQYWRIAGTWLEEERAYYQLARSLLAAGRPGEAVAAAQACLDVCARNDAPEFERFFGWAVLAIARRAEGDEAGYVAARSSALAAHARVAPDEQAWCAKDLAAIAA